MSEEYLIVNLVIISNLLKGHQKKLERSLIAPAVKILYLLKGHRKRLEESLYVIIVIASNH